MARRTQTFDIYVGNLPIDANDKNVGKLFVSYGEIASVYVRADNKDPNSKFSFVRFLCEPDADRAAKEMNNMKLEDRHISVKRCGTSTPKTGGALEKTGNQTRKGKGKKSGGRNSETESTDGSVQDPSERAGGDGAPRSEVLQPPNPHPASLKETAMCTHVETPVSVWLQIVSDENTKKIFNITEQLSTLCPAAPKLTGQPDMNKVYACNFSEDGMWYRCMVRNSLGTDRFKIQYIDYGNTEEVTLGSLVEIPQNVAAMKGLAQKIVLHNTLPKDLSDKNAVQYLKSLTDGQMVQLIKTRPLTDGTGFFGHLIVNGQSINDAVIQAGHAYKRPQMDKSGGRDQQPNTKPFSNPPSLLGAPGTPPLIGGGDASMNPMMNKHPGTPAMVDTAAMQPGPAMMGTSMFGGRERSMRSPNDAAGGNRQMKSMGQSNEPSGKEKELQAELTKKRREFERVRNEKDAARLEVEYMKSKVKTLQDEFSMTAAKMAEDTVAKRISSLVSLASRVRQLREQFPTGRQCLLEEAISLCQSPDRVDNSSLTSMAAVGSSLNTYKAAQKEISSCKDQPELSNLIASRDDARRDLYLKLTVCITELEKMPLEKRTASVQDIQMRLVNTYAQFLKFHIHDCPSMENLVPGFKNWKSKKDLEYADVRTATNFSEEALQTALSNVKQCVSVSSTEGTEKSDVDLDDLMKTYAHSLQREINVTDTEHSKDSSLIAAVIASVRRELTTEISMLENFRGLHREFTSLKSVIEPWLERKPTLTDIQENRKTLRSLKSKLRHLMADKQDLEEVLDLSLCMRKPTIWVPTRSDTNRPVQSQKMSGDEEELQTIKDEEVKVRNLIQETLVKSDELSNEVAKLADTNFPELILQFPDLGIDMQLTYSGLIKSNRDIDHYTLTPGLKPGTHRSTFNGVPVLIQEFHIGDTEHRSKEEFIKQTIAFNGTSGDIQAIFFSKSERLAYIQSLWRDGRLLESFVQDHTLTAPEIQKVSLGVVQAVCDLHRRNFVHGEINPLNIVVHEGCDVTLLVPDFSKSLVERINKRYTTENGLVFQTPELAYTSAEAVGPASDVYNLVLLMFWFHCLSVKMSQRSDGTPETKIPNTDVSLQRLFDRVISGKSAAGMQAEQLLQLDYFRKTILTEEHAPPIAPESTVAHSTVAPSGVAQSVGANSPGALSMVVQQLQTSVPVQEQVIPQPNQQMEIGVFNMKDVIGGEEIMAAQIDTDDSWTTKSSSSGSRDSPLEALTGGSKTAGEITNTETVADNVLQGGIQPAVIGDFFSQAAEEGMFSQGGGDFSQTDAALYSHAASDMDFGAGGDIFSQAGDSPFMVFDNAKDLKKGRSPEPTGDGLELSETVKSVLNGVGELTIDSENKSNSDINASGSTAVSKDIEDDGDVDDGIREHGMTEKEMVDLMGSFANTTNFLTTSIEHGNSLGAAENTDSCKERIKVDKTSSTGDNSVPTSTDDHISTQLFKNNDGTSTQSQEHMSPGKFLQNLRTLQGLFSKRPTVAAHKLMPNNTSTHISTNTDVKIQVFPKRDMSEVSSTEAIGSKSYVVVLKIDDVASKIGSIASKTVASDTYKIGSKTDRIAPNTTLIANTMPKTDTITSKTDSIVLKTDTVAAKTDIVELKTGTVASKAGTLASNADTVALKTDTVAPKSDTVAHKTDTVAHKTDTVAPKTDTVTPKTNTVAPETDTVASKTNTVAPKTDTVAPKTDTVASTTDTVASKTDKVATKTDTVATKTDTVASKTNTVAPKTDTVASTTDTVAPKTDKVATKTDTVASKTNTVAPKTNTVAPKTDTVASKTNTMAPKSDTVAHKTDTVAHKTDTVAPKTNTVAPKTDTGASKTDTVASKTDKVAPKTDTVATKIDTVASKTNTVAPKTNTVAPKTDTVATKTDTVASKTNTVAPKTNTVAPKTNTVAPETDTVASKTNKVAPKTNTVAPKTTTVAPKTNTVAPKTDTVAPKTNTVAPKTDTVASKTDTVASKTDKVAPKTDTVATKIDTVASKTNTVAPKTNTVSPTTNTVAPKTDTVALKTNTVAPKTNTVAPKTNTVAPKTNTVAPKTDTVATKTNRVAPKTDTVAPKTDTVAPKTNRVAPKTDTVAPKTDTVAPKTDTVAPKTDTVAPKTPKMDIVAPKTDTVAPRTDTIASYAIASMIDTITSKIDTVFSVADSTVPKIDTIASKTDTIASGILVSSDITQKPTTTDVSTQSSPNFAGGILEPSEADPIASDPETPPMPSFSLTHILNMMKEGK